MFNTPSNTYNTVSHKSSMNSTNVFSWLFKVCLTFSTCANETDGIVPPLSFNFVVSADSRHQLHITANAQYSSPCIHYHTVKPLTLELNSSQQSYHMPYRFQIPYSHRLKTKRDTLERRDTVKTYYVQ